MLVAVALLVDAAIWMSLALTVTTSQSGRNVLPARILILLYGVLHLVLGIKVL